MKQKKRAHVVINGRVQGVCFRMETQIAANGFGVSGWVKNNRDGSVEAVFEGNEGAVASILEWCKEGPPSAKVNKVDVKWETFTGEFRTFEITF